MPFRDSYIPRRRWRGRAVRGAVASTALASTALVLTVHAQSPSARPPVPRAPGAVTAFVGVNVVPMDTERVLPNHTVVVKGGRITALGPTSTVKVPAGAVRIDGQGKYLIPGLADMHAHLATVGLPGMAPLPPTARYDSLEAAQRLLLWLAHGVTTVRNVDYMEEGATWKIGGRALRWLRARAAAGELLSPRIYTSGQWAPSQYTGYHFFRETPPWTTRPTPRLDSVAAYVAAYKAAGFDFVKIHDESGAVRESLAVAATRVGLPVMGHAYRMEHALKAGLLSIEHLSYITNSPPDTSLIAPLVAETRRAGLWNTPTLALLERQQPEKGLRFRRQFVQALQAAGAGLLLGTDAPILDDPEHPNPMHGDGGAVHRELEALVRAGLTPYQALQTGTRNVAVYFNTLAESGTVAVGKRADLVLLTGNPLEDIRHSRRIAGVTLGGRWLPREELDRRVAARAVLAEP